MASPKNWKTDNSPSFYDGKAVHKKNIEHAWSHRETDHKVFVAYEPDFDDYRVYLNKRGRSMSRGKNIGRRQNYKNKKKARKAAVSWMRNHPTA